MDFVSLFTFGLMIILLIIVVVFSQLNITHLNKKNITDIPTFSVDVQWEEYPTSVDIDNSKICDAETLVKCDTRDPTTLFGCKELAVRCIHFENDTPYYKNGNQTIIPKNDSEFEGYALSVTTIVDSCNPFHGNLVLVTTQESSSEYVLICECKNPGYIGNDNILGNCTTIYICNGEIDDINKPLNEINCICNKREISIRYDDGLPVCKALFVHEANSKYSDWTNLVPWMHGTDHLIQTSVYNNTIKNNLNCSTLLNPCELSIHDTKMIISGGKYDSLSKTCSVEDRGGGILLRTGILSQSGIRDGGDYTIETVDAVFYTNKITKIRFSDNIGGLKRMINVETTWPWDPNGTPVYVNFPPNIALGDTGQLRMHCKNQINNGRCEGNWPSFSCQLRDYFSKFTKGLPEAGYRNPPAFFVGNETWKDAEKIVSFGVVPFRFGIGLTTSYFTFRTEKTKFCGGMQYCNEDTVNCLNGMMSCRDENDAKQIKNILTF